MSHSPVTIAGDSTSRIRLLVIISLICLSVALSAYAYLGLFNRYLIDDYCVVAALRDKGFFGTQKFLYQNWSGRYTYNFLSTLISYSGNQTTIILPALSIIIWLFTINWSVKQFDPKAFLPQPSVSTFLFALLLIYATLQGTPTLLQSFYWRAGMLTYLAPLILLTAYAGFIRYRAERNSRKIIWLLISAGFTFFSGGLSETALALQAGALLMLIIVCLKSPENSLRRAALPLLIAGLMGSLLSGFIQLLSNGNALRQSAYPAHPSWLSIIELSLSETRHFILASMRTKTPLSLSVSLLLPFAIGFMANREARQPVDNKQRILLLAALPLIALILVWLSILPSIYAIPYPPLPRTLIMPHYVLTLFCMAEGYILGLTLRDTLPLHIHLKQVISFIIVAAILLLGPLRATKRAYKISTKIKRQAARWDKTDQMIKNVKQQGKAEIEIQNLAWFAESVAAFEDFEKIEADPNYQFNQCIEKYYELRLKKIK